MGNPLVAFALVADEYEKSGDPIKGLKPLFSPLLHDKGGTQFNAEAFADEFSRRYGLSMSSFIAEALAERMCEVGLLIPAGTAGKNSYLVADFDWSANSIEEQQIDKTVGLFTRWAEQRAKAAGRSFDLAWLEDAFLLRLARPEFASIFSDEDGDKKNKRFKGLLGLGGVDPTAKDEEFADYLVAEFILTATDSAPVVFESLSQISHGALIADAVAGLAVPAVGVATDPPLRVMVDGPLILDLLDLNTAEHKEYAENLLKMMQEAGFMLGVFDHSVEEMRQTIKGTLQAHASGVGFGPMAQRFRTQPGYTLYANTVLNSIESKVKDLGFFVVRSDIYLEARYLKFFPEDREDQVRNQIGDLHEHMDARMRDARSVATVARLKGERRYPDDVLHAGTIFITRNSVLCKRVMRALSLGRSEPEPRFTISTDGQFAGVLWFISGIAGVELSRKRLIANCSSAVLPKPEIVARMTAILGGLDESLRQEFEALMTDRRASMCPMRMTGGSVDSLDESRTLAILAEMKAELIAPAVERVHQAEAAVAEQRREIEAVSAHGKEVAAVLQGALEQEQIYRSSDAVQFNEQLAQLSHDLELFKEKAKTSEEDLSSRRRDLDVEVIERSSALDGKRRRLKRWIVYSLFLLSAIATLFTIFFPDYKSNWLKIIVAAIYLASLPWLSKLLDNAAIRFVSMFFLKETSYIDGLKRAQQQLK